MEAFDFLKEAQRLCKSYHNCECCPLVNYPCGFIRCIVDHSDAEMRCVTKVVEQWSKEHPVITNEMKFKEVFGFSLENTFILPSEVCNWLRTKYEEP